MGPCPISFTYMRTWSSTLSVLWLCSSFVPLFRTRRVQHGMPLPALHELRELEGQVGDLSVQRTYVHFIGAREPGSRLPDPVPQVAFPQVQRGDLDRLCGLDFVCELRRQRAKRRGDRGQVSGQIGSRLLASLQPCVDGSQVGIFE